MWNMIQNLCVGIVAFELVIMVSLFVSMYLDEMRKDDDDDYVEPGICGIRGDGSPCIHSGEWIGLCDDCPICIEYEKEQQEKQEMKNLEQLINKSVREALHDAMEEK